MGEALDPNFSVHRVVFSPQEFMEVLSQNKDNLPGGSVILFEELGCSMSNRKWYSDFNVMVNYVLQTFRTQNLICFFTVPNPSLIDAQTRKLLHAQFETLGVNKHKKVSYLKPFLIDINSRDNSTYMTFPKFKLNGKSKKIRCIYLEKASNALIKQYEAKRKVFSDNLRNNASAAFVTMTNSPGKKMLTAKQQRIYELKIKGTTVNSIAEQLGINPSVIADTCHAIRRKGYIC
jgi:hypothetical protein